MTASETPRTIIESEEYALDWKTEDLKVTRRHALKDFNRKHPQVKKDLEAKKQQKLRF